MLDSVAVLPPGFRVTDANDDPVSGAKLKFYNAGTSTPKEVFADAALSTSLGSTVTCDSGGYPTTDGSTKTIVYTGTADYKLVITTSADVVIATHDNLQGAIASADLGGGMTDWETDVTAITTDTTLTSVHRGQLIQANPTGGTFQLTLESAITAGNGTRQGVRHNGTANQVKLATVSGQYIKTRGGSTTSGVGLTSLGHTMWLVSDGAGWIVDIEVEPIGIGSIIQITDRLTAAPASPTAGARYILNGTPTGTWLDLGFDQHDVLEADGQGGWIEYSPANGWLAYVQDEQLLTQFRGSAWTDLSNITAPTSSYLGQFHGQYELANGTLPDTITSGSWQNITSSAGTRWTEKSDTLTSGATIATDGTVSLPASKYLVIATVGIDGAAGAMKMRLIDGASTVLGTSFHANGVSGDIHPLMVMAPLDLSAGAGTVKPQVWLTSSSRPGVLHGDTTAEVYGQIIILDLKALQGPQGVPGPQGSPGADGVDGADAGLSFTFNSSTSAADPGTGRVAFNNATPASITAMYISETDSDGNGLASEIASWDDGANAVKSRLRFQKGGDPTKVLVLDVTGTLTDNGGWDTVTVQYVRHTGSFSNLDGLKLTPGIKGDTGAAGSTGASGPVAVDYTWDTGTSASDPGAGKVRANNANLASATALYISETDRLGVSLASYIQAWDDSTSTHKGVLEIVDLATPANRVFFNVTGTVTDGGGFDTITIAHRSGVTSLTAVNVALMFHRTGDKGADGAGSGDVVGPSSSTNNSLARFDGTTGKLLKDGAIIGADVQAYSANLAIWSVVTPSSNGQSLVAAANYAAMRGLLDLEAGTDFYSIAAANAAFQPLDSDLTSWATVTRASGYDTFAASPTLANLKSLVSDDDPAGLGAQQEWTRQQYSAYDALTDGTNIAWDVQVSQKAKVTLGGNRTMSAVTNAIEGATYLLFVVQDGTGSRTLSWTTSGSGSFDFGADGAPTLTTTASKADLLAFEAFAIGGTLKLRYAGIKKGFA